MHQVFYWGQININSEVVEEDGMAIHQCFEVITAIAHRQGCGLGGRRDIDGQIGINARSQGCIGCTCVRFQKLRRMSAGLANGQAGILNGQTARCHAFIGAVLCVGGLDVNAGHRDIQFMCCDELQCMQDALTQFSFACEDRH